jgi:hypothetical protein
MKMEMIFFQTNDVEDAAKHGIETIGLWTVDVKSTVKTENIEEAFEDRMNKKVAKNDDVEYASKHGIEKTWVENKVKTEHFVQESPPQSSLRHVWKHPQHPQFEQFLIIFVFNCIFNILSILKIHPVFKM